MQVGADMTCELTSCDHMKTALRPEGRVATLLAKKEISKPNTDKATFDFFLPALLLRTDCREVIEVENGFTDRLQHAHSTQKHKSQGPK
eukprot:878738-Amphidinium_carterae.1